MFARPSIKEDREKGGPTAALPPFAYFLTRSTLAMSARIGVPLRFVPNEYVDVGGTGAAFPFRDDVSYFTEMMNEPLEGNVPVAVPSAFTVSDFHLSVAHPGSE